MFQQSPYSAKKIQLCPTHSHFTAEYKLQPSYVHLVYLSIWKLSIYLSIDLSIYLYLYIYIYIYIFIFIYIYLSISIYLSTYLPIYLSTYLPIYLST